MIYHISGLTYCQLKHCRVRWDCTAGSSHGLQLISWYQRAWALKLAFSCRKRAGLWSFLVGMESSLSIIINQNHHNHNTIKNIQMMDTESIQNTLRWKQTKMKWRFHSRTCFKAVKFGKKAVLLYHKNLTVKIVMPPQDYKAQYLVKINRYFLPFHLFLLHRRIWLFGCHCVEIQCSSEDSGATFWLPRIFTFTKSTFLFFKKGNNSGYMPPLWHLAHNMDVDDPNASQICPLRWD